VLALLDEDHLAALLARRREWGADVLDEVWSGVRRHLPIGDHGSLQQSLAELLLASAGPRRSVPILGAYEPCGPDSGARAGQTRQPLRGDESASAALAVEIIPSQGRVTPRLAALAADHVGEVVVVDVERRTVVCLALAEGEYRPVDRSELLDLDSAALSQMIAWPSNDER
jgi:hypothetical protein